MFAPAHFAIITKSRHVSFADLKRIAQACDTQMKEDFYPIWQRHADVAAYTSASAIPAHAWKVTIMDDIGQPGALGFHQDEFGQPVCYVAAQGGDIAAISVTCSHEIIEATCDPFGNRLIAAAHPMNTGERVRILCEPCDPSEASSYSRHGNLPVSDFYFPEWFDDTRTDGQKYSFMNMLPEPRTLIAGGYLSFVASDSQWYQVTWFNGSQAILEGPFNWQRKAHQSLRSMVDEQTRLRRVA